MNVNVSLQIMVLKTFVPITRLVLNMIFYGIMLYVPGLAGNLYLNVFLMFVTDLPHTPMAWIVFK